jgi:AcrR family transcriptional regulator
VPATDTPSGIPAHPSVEQRLHGAAGLRERNKREKRQRIREATRELFSGRGFEAATLRQIADRAQVGLGTLFSYARDKRDLTFLLFNDDLARLVDEAAAGAARKTRTLDRVMAMWEPHYRFFARDPVLSRPLLRDMYFYVDGTEAQRFLLIARRLRDDLHAVLVADQRAGRLRSDVSAEDLASLVFLVFTSSVREWMFEDGPVASEGLSTLRTRLALLLNGFVPQPSRATRSNGRPIRRRQ